MGGETTDVDLKKIKQGITAAKENLKRALSHHAVVSKSHELHQQNLRGKLTLANWEEWGETVEKTEEKVQEIALQKRDIKQAKDALQSVGDALGKVSGALGTEGAALKEYKAFDQAVQSLIAYLTTLKEDVGGEHFFKSLAIAAGQWLKKVE